MGRLESYFPALRTNYLAHMSFWWGVEDHKKTFLAVQLWKQRYT